MPIDCEGLKNYAIELIAQDATEMQIRTSIAKSYYSIFHALLPFGAILPRSKKCPAAVQHLTHQELEDRINEWNTSAIDPGLSRLTAVKSQVWRALRAARAERVNADYRLGGDISLGEAKMQIERARLILRMVVQINNVISPTNVAGKE